VIEAGTFTISKAGVQGHPGKAGLDAIPILNSPEITVEFPTCIGEIFSCKILLYNELFDIFAGENY
jgi:hypothetical protein